MNRFKWIYTVALLLLGLICSIPQLAWVASLGLTIYHTRQIPFTIPGLQPTIQMGNQLIAAPFCDAGFITMTGEFDQNARFMKWKFDALDPETGKTSTYVDDIVYTGSYRTYQYGSRIWFEDVPSGKFSEIVAGRMIPSNLVTRTLVYRDGQTLLLNGEPATIEKGLEGFSIWTFTQGKWLESHRLDLSDFEQAYGLSLADASPFLQRKPSCLTCGTGQHLLLSTKYGIYYRDGLPLVPIETSQPSAVTDAATEGTDDATNGSKSASDNRGTNSAWTQAFDFRKAAIEFSGLQPVNLEQPMMFVNGEPVLLVLFQQKPQRVQGFFYRRIGQDWVRFAEQTFPFAADKFRTVTTADGLRSYVVAATPLGQSTIYRLETDGPKLMPGVKGHYIIPDYWKYMIRPAVNIIAIATLILGAAAWVMMSRMTTDDYSFGLSTVQLAPLLHRGVARLIDLTLVLGITLAVATYQLRSMDWMTLAEALNLAVRHPTISVLENVLI